MRVTTFINEFYDADTITYDKYGKSCENVCNV